MKLIVTARLQDRANTTKLTSVHIRNETLEWIENNTTGNNQATINYLLMRGIESLKEEGDGVLVDDIASVSSQIFGE
ncbi:hypothetical protein [Marinobacter salarius]|uniref:hypothetical protein n=1 Tax=Marinobacter salarius TaxID=1420917 RepID=UPI003BAA71A3